MHLQEVLAAFEGHDVQVVLHAGDVGSHGGHAEVLSSFQRCANCIAVRGNVDDTASIEELPEHVSQTIAGWEIFVTHIADPGQGQEGLRGVPDRTPDIVIHGHSHKYGVRKEDGVLFINPGSAGPARFKLPRTAAIVELRPKEQGTPPSISRIDLAAKAPKRIQAASTGAQKRRRKA
ncbi:g7447 [Coccomyxa viridis]|uniref:Vacuolar protein sorting-associated protein 29 n=1 Tax=Coccomyxa viridis TaxID=1274662 RepID=A0ABP1G1X9_9CHLO